MKILAVDDDAFFLQILSAALGALGYTDVTLVESSASAAQFIAETEEPFDCFLVDLTMPEIEGDYLCRWIRRQAAYHDTPIIIISAKTEKSHVDNAFLAGASDYITKPLDLGELQKRLDRVVKGIKRSKNLAAHAAPQDEVQEPQQHRQFYDAWLPEGVRGMMELEALENYVLKLARAEMYKMSAFAVTIGDAARLFRTCRPEVFDDILASAANAIRRRLSEKGLVMAYAGYGAFLCLATDFKINGKERDAIEAEVTQAALTSFAARRHGTPQTLALGMSLPQDLSIWSGAKAIDAMYRTIGDAEIRTQKGPAL